MSHKKAQKAQNEIKAIAGGFSFPTSLAFDDAGGMYVAESGLPFGGAPPGGLADPKTYQQNIQAFEAVLTYPITDPRYMPVTRDMSRDKRNVLLAWLAAGAPL